MPFIEFIKKTFGKSEKVSHYKAATTTNETNGSDSELSQEMLRNLLKFQEKTAEDIMVPRADIIAISVDTKADELKEMAQAHSFSRFPVFGENLDDIRGFVSIHDLVMLTLQPDQKITSKIQPLLYVPTSMPVMHLLIKMRQEKVPIAIVVDEFGGTDGVVTSWNILRELIDNVHLVKQEEPDAFTSVVVQEDGSIIADARASIEELERVSGLTFSAHEGTQEADTVGGFVMFLAGRVPDRAEVISAEDETQFEIIDATPRRILRVRVHPSGRA